MPKRILVSRSMIDGRFLAGVLIMLAVGSIASIFMAIKNK